MGSQPTLPNRKSRADRLKALREEAYRRPGVKEMMEVYENWRRVDSVVDCHRKKDIPRTVVTVANSADTTSP